MVSGRYCILLKRNFFFGGLMKFHAFFVSRYMSFLKCISGSRVQLAGLPPSEAAAKQHSLRTYLQVQSCMGRDLSATEYGWKRSAVGLIPIESSLPTAPQQVLKLISDECKELFLYFVFFSSQNINILELCRLYQ